MRGGLRCGQNISACTVVVRDRHTLERVHEAVKAAAGRKEEGAHSRAEGGTAYRCARMHYMLEMIVKGGVGGCLVL